MGLSERNSASVSSVFYFVGKDMDAKQDLHENNTNFCAVTGYTIYTYNNFLETFVTLFRASMGGYDVSPLERESMQYEEFACANYQGLTKALFVLYMFILPISKCSSMGYFSDDQHPHRHDGQHLSEHHRPGREGLETAGLFPHVPRRLSTRRL